MLLYVSSCYYICVLKLLCMSPHATICVLILLHMCPHTAIYVCSYSYVCVPAQNKKSRKMHLVVIVVCGRIYRYSSMRLLLVVSGQIYKDISMRLLVRPAEMTREVVKM